MTRYLPPRERRLRALLAEARDLMRRHRPLNARLRCQQVLSLDPDHAEALTLLGVLAGRGGDLDEALVHLDRAIALRPDDPAVLNNLGSALAGLDRHDEALAAFDRALELRPDHAEAHANRRLLRSMLRAQGRLLPHSPELDDELVPLRPQFVIDQEAAEAARNAPPEPDSRDALIDQALGQAGADLAQAERSLDAAGADAFARLGGLRSVAVLVTARALGAVEATPQAWCRAAHAALAPGGLWALTVDDAGSAAPWLPLGAVYDLAELQAAAAAAGLDEVLSGSGPLRELRGCEVNGHLLLLRRPAAA